MKSSGLFLLLLALAVPSDLPAREQPHGPGGGLSPASTGAAESSLTLARDNAPQRTASDAEIGEFFLQQYTPAIYDANAQNWDVVQDRRGIIFVANNDGVLEYDGARWRLIPVGGKPVFSLAVGRDDRIYVGSQNELGYLEADTRGLHFVSLLSKLPLKQRELGYVRAIHVTSAGVWFRSAPSMLQLEPGGAFKVWDQVKPRRSFALADSVYVASPQGFFELRENGPKDLPLSSAIKAQNIRAYCPFLDARIIATTEGLFRESVDGLKPWKTEADSFLQSRRISTALPLRNGTLAVGTYSGGLAILRSNGTLVRLVDEHQDLQSQLVRALYEDSAAALWVVLDKGLATIEAESPLTYFSRREGAGERVSSLARYRGHLYAGLSTGLAQLSPANGAEPPHFVPVPGTSRLIVTLLPTVQGLLAAGESGVYAIDGETVQPVVSGTAIYDLAPLTGDPDVVLAAGAGLLVLRHEHSGWHLERRIPAGSQEFRSVRQDHGSWAWVTTSTGSVLRVNWTEDPAIVQTVEQSSKKSQDYINVFCLHSGVLFATSTGLKTFDTASQRIVPAVQFSSVLGGSSRPVSLVAETTNGDLWVSGKGYHGVLRRSPSGELSWQAGPLERAGIKEVYGMHVDDDGVVWASGSDGGLARLVPSQARPRTGARTLIRKIESLNTKSVLFAGETAIPAHPSLAYRDNALRFEFAMPEYTDEAHTEYQVKLEGLDKHWSTWSQEAGKEYTNLPEHSYTIRVRARDSLGSVHDEISYGFAMLPPWYRTWWAYGAYILLCIGSIVLVFRWRLAQLAAQNRRLENIVLERTVEVRQQRDEIRDKEAQTERLLLNILPSTVANELRRTGEVIPQSYDQVAVCFTDFVGFTLASEKMTAEELVQTLHSYFSAFDEVIQRYGLERLKTIGDSYMFVGGLPEPSSSFAVDIVLAALEILNICEQMSASRHDVAWRIRLGIHCGSATAGVVGTRKFAFDIWGATVNLASRIESCGSPNRVNLSEETYELVRDFIQCEARGPVRTKEGRHLVMYFACQLRGTFGPGEDFASLYQSRFGKEPPEVRLNARPLEAASAIR